MDGSSHIHWGMKYALHTSEADLHLCHLGLRVHWKGTRDMKWRDMLPFVKSQLRIQGNKLPSILIIHLGSNDLVSTPIHTLLTQVEHDVKEIHGLMPGTVLVWSNVLLRLFLVWLK